MKAKQVRSRYTLEFQLEAVRQVKTGRSVAEVDGDAAWPSRCATPAPASA